MVNLAARMPAKLFSRRNAPRSVSCACFSLFSAVGVRMTVTHTVGHAGTGSGDKIPHVAEVDAVVEVADGLGPGSGSDFAAGCII